MKCFLPTLALLLLNGPALVAQSPKVDAGRLARIDALVDASVARGDCPGAVVVVVQADQVLYRKAFGDRATRPAKVPMTPETIFDLASLTKPLATAGSIMVLIEQGKLRPSDKVAKHWPEFAANGKATVTVEQCLLHTSGLIADNAISDFADGKATAFERIANLKLEAAPGTRFRYSDVGYMVLGELVERLGKMPLNQFAAENLFTPMKLLDTGYLPTAKDRIAPTGLRDGATILGEVHDPRSFKLGGVAGHAGLFATADDVASYARMLLNNGELDGVRILGPRTVEFFTEPRPVPGGLRTFGFDAETSFSAPRGELFSGSEGFGHTGFTGTSIWCDRPSRTAVIIMTNRVHPDDKGNVTELRRQVATVVASALPAAPKTIAKPLTIAVATQPRASRPVLTGIDVLRRDKFAKLAGKRIGLVTNHTGLAADGTPTIDLIAAAPGVKLVALFSPEHGIRGERDEKVGDTTDTKTGLTVYSLYGERRKPTAKLLEGIDLLVYDIQDIGCRFYTYASTLGLLLEAAAESKIPVLVLDRPNPIGGTLIEGPIRDAMRQSFVGFHTVPLRHGMTVGELARMFNTERGTGADLSIIPVENWSRADTYDATNLPWRNPSPNMRHLTAALLYPGVGVLEFTNLSVGRGTERPFEWVGAPYLESRTFAAALNARNIPGVRFVPTARTPSASVFANQACGGVDLIVTNWDTVRPVRIGLELATVLRQQHPEQWTYKKLDALLLSATTLDAIGLKRNPTLIEAGWAADLDAFRARRAKFLLYDE